MRINRGVELELEHRARRCHVPIILSDVQNIDRYEFQEMLWFDLLHFFFSLNKRKRKTTSYDTQWLSL